MSPQYSRVETEEWSAEVHGHIIERIIFWCRLPGPGTRRQPATAINGHQYDYDFGLHWIAGSAILVIPQTQHIAGRKISGFERNVFTWHNYPDSEVFGFKVQTLDFLFKISGDVTKPGCFHFGFVLLCVNGKTNPVLKRSRFITNPEQFPLV